jgi:S1-C subfamily serine protease
MSSIPREHAMTDNPSSTLAAFSEELARRVAAVAPGLVAVHGRRGPSFSGFVWRTDAVVTAEEALESDDDIAVTAADGRDLKATLAGRDPSTDVAVLRVEGLDTVVPLAPAAADALQAGHLALAAGRRAEGPIAHLGAVAVAGAAWRSMRGGRIDRFLRLDMRLDARAEGGVLLDPRDGRVFGMAVHGPRRSVLAIPAATIERVAPRLLAEGRIARGYLGLGLQPVRLDEAVAKALGLEAARGLMVVGVDPEGPGRKAGVLQGDVVTAWDGEAVRRVRDVFERLGPDSIGNPAALALVRAGARASAEVAIVERPAASG